MNDISFSLVGQSLFIVMQESDQKVGRIVFNGRDIGVLYRDKVYLRAAETGVPKERLPLDFDFKTFGYDDTPYVELKDVIRWYERLRSQGRGTAEDLDFLEDLKKFRKKAESQFNLV